MSMQTKVVDDVTAIIVPLPAYNSECKASFESAPDILSLPKILREEAPQTNKEANDGNSQLIILSLPAADYFHFAEVCSFW